MRLHNIISSPAGSAKDRKRLGRGRGSGHGKTSTRGHKGQRARSGSKGVAVAFQGGAIPLYRTLPHRGFSNKRFKGVFNLVNLRDLELVDGDMVDASTLVASGLIRDNGNPVKLLGDGEIGRALTVKVDKVSGSAKAKIEAAGGKVIVPEAAQ